MSISSCNESTSSPHPPGLHSNLRGTFGYDIAFLWFQDPDLAVLGRGDAKIIVSPKYQGKVFSSTTGGDDGPSLGWIHYPAFDAAPDLHMNAYGGENRIWLGPEGGPFSVFFRPGDPMVFDNWRTPPAFDTEPWRAIGRDSQSIVLYKETRLINYAGFVLHLSIDRRITVIDRRVIDSLLMLTAEPGVRAVGYRTRNCLTNQGHFAWDEKTGMPCIWILDMFPPSDSTTIVIPYKPAGSPHSSGSAASSPSGSTTSEKPATTDYFGEIPDDRIVFRDSTLFFKADGKMRGKLGMHPDRATNIAGSYDADKKVLTIILFDLDDQAKYMNQEWRTDRPPFSGDVMNAYNDGPLVTGGQLGPFYELESVSPAAFLKPGDSLVHRHHVFHFTGDEEGLDRIARKTLHVSLTQIKNALANGTPSQK